MAGFRDDDGNRYGDWQKKDLRKNANEIIEDPDQKPWYQQTFWVIALLVLFWPVGIVLCWRGNWHIVAKIAATVFVVFCVVMSYNMWSAVQQMGL